MNDELQEQLVEYLKRGGVFVEEQAPLIAQEMLAWGFWVHLLGLIMGVIATVGAPLVIWWMIAQGIKRDWDGEPVAAVTACSAVVFVIGLIAACHNGYMLLQVCIAPKVYLLDQFLGR